MHAAEPPVGGAAEALPTCASAVTGLSVERIRKRQDFLAANSGTRIVTPAFILLVKPRGPATRSGFTVSRKVGNAVVRNRAKRRLREITSLVFPELAIAGADHVMIARARPVELPFATLLADVRAALTRARRKMNPSA